MSEYLFVGGPLHGKIEDIYKNPAVEPDGSINLRVTVNNEVVCYERSDYSRWRGPQYNVAVFEGASELIQKTIDETGYKPYKN